MQALFGLGGQGGAGADTSSDANELDSDLDLDLDTEYTEFESSSALETATGFPSSENAPEPPPEKGPLLPSTGSSCSGEGSSEDYFSPPEHHHHIVPGLGGTESPAPPLHETREPGRSEPESESEHRIASHDEVPVPRHGAPSIIGCGSSGDDISNPNGPVEGLGAHTVDGPVSESQLVSEDESDNRLESSPKPKPMLTQSSNPPPFPHGPAEELGAHAVDEPISKSQLLSKTTTVDGNASNLNKSSVSMQTGSHNKIPSLQESKGPIEKALGEPVSENDIDIFQDYEAPAEHAPDDSCPEIKVSFDQGLHGQDVLMRRGQEAISKHLASLVDMVVSDLEVKESCEAVSLCENEKEKEKNSFSAPMLEHNGGAGGHSGDESLSAHNNKSKSLSEFEGEHNSLLLSRPNTFSSSSSLPGPNTRPVSQHTECLHRFCSCLPITPARVQPLFSFLPLFSASSSPSQPEVSFRLPQLGPRVYGSPVVGKFDGKTTSGQAWCLAQGDTVILSAEEPRSALLHNPSQVPNNTKMKEKVAAGAFEKRFIGKGLGYGLFTTREIRAGETLFVDPLMCVWAGEESACKTREQLEGLLEKKAKKMGPGWYDRFIHLAGEQVEGSRAGVKSIIWNKHRFPTAVNGRIGAVLGINLSWINHACIPNCILRYVNKYPANEGGDVCWEAEPKMGAVVVRSCTNIKPNRELNISYVQTEGSFTMRQEEMKRLFGWTCKCQACAKPVKAVEEAMLKYHRHKGTFCNPGNIANRPALCLQMAHNLIHQLEVVGLRDSRLVDIYVKCGFIVGHHSDLARASCFLRHARDLSLLLEGNIGYSSREIAKWLRSPKTMKGYGSTAWGLSTIAEGLAAFEGGMIPDEAIFMLGRSLDEYVRMNRYRSLSEEEKGMCRAKCHVYCHRSFKILDAPDEKPPKLDIKEKTPFDMCRAEPGDPDCTVPQKLEEEEKKRRLRRKQERAAREKQKPDCDDPRKDWYHILRGSFGISLPLLPGQDYSADCSQVTNNDPVEKPQQQHDASENTPHEEKPVEGSDNPDEQQDEDPKPERRKKKSKKSKGKGKAPMVQDVGAEKKPNIIREEEDSGAEAEIE